MPPKKCRGSIWNKFIAWKASCKTFQFINKLINKFYGLAHFPKVIGAIDCTHIKLQSPSREYGEQYRNRKGYFSLNLQALVNANLEFLDVVARWLGSAHDSNIFANSKLRARMELHEFKNCVILGDAGYALSHYLLTPLANPTTKLKNCTTSLKLEPVMWWKGRLESGNEGFLSYFLDFV